MNIKDLERDAYNVNPGGVSDDEWETIKSLSAALHMKIMFDETGQLDKDFLRGFRMGGLLGKKLIKENPEAAETASKLIYDRVEGDKLKALNTVTKPGNS